MMHINLDLSTPEKQADAMRRIAVEIETGRARVIDVGIHPTDSTILVFLLQGAKLDS
jgi:hypothetical protein